MIKCLIIDDEPLARDILESYCKEHSQLQLVGTCKNALDAKALMETEAVDLLFLDINMPELSGLNFYKTLIHKPKVIFTTAYAEYAVEGFELEAVDYLLKPFSFERFEKAVNKLSTYASPQNYLLLKADKRTHKVDYEKISYFESMGDYVKVILSEGKNLIINETLKNLDQQLPEAFIRVHRSYIIAIQQIQFLEGNQVKVVDKMIPIGQAYRQNLERALHAK
jgi:DNA-binding LytR/AlgR family response regulator